MKTYLLLLGIGFAAGYFYASHHKADVPEVFEPAPSLTSPQPLNSSIRQPNYECDGRQHCSQMKSYEEALFFIHNCPNTKMDGDNDGIPCERKFSRY